MAAPLLALLPALLPILSDVIKRTIPDPEAQAKAQADLAMAISENAERINLAGAEIVKAEAQGESWLQKSWRPITMLTFLAIIVARMLGFTAPGISEAEYLALWNMMELGIIGYVISRGAEKTLPNVASILTKK
jgi:hypothetical protein